MRPETSVLLSALFVLLLAGIAAAGTWALLPLGWVAALYPALFLAGHLPAMWFGCRGCAKRGYRCVVIPHGGRVAARLFAAGPLGRPPARMAAAFCLAACYGGPAVVAWWQGGGPALVVDGALLCTYALARRAAVQVVFDGWAATPVQRRRQGVRWTAT